MNDSIEITKLIPCPDVLRGGTVVGEYFPVWAIVLMLVLAIAATGLSVGSMIQLHKERVAQARLLLRLASLSGALFAIFWVAFAVFFAETFGQCNRHSGTEFNMNIWRTSAVESTMFVVGGVLLATGALLRPGSFRTAMVLLGAALIAFVQLWRPEHELLGIWPFAIPYLLIIIAVLGDEPFGRRKENFSA